MSLGKENGTKQTNLANVICKDESNFRLIQFPSIQNQGRETKGILPLLSLYIYFIQHRPPLMSLWKFILNSLSFPNIIIHL